MTLFLSHREDIYLQQKNMKYVYRVKQNQEMANKSWSYCLFSFFEQCLKSASGILYVTDNHEVNFCCRDFHHNTGISQAITFSPGSCPVLNNSICVYSSSLYFNIKTEYRSPENTLIWGMLFPQRESLVGYSPRGHKESDTTEWLHFPFHLVFISL